jgi:hypothetical protein
MSTETKDMSEVRVKRTKRDPSKGLAFLLDELKEAKTKKEKHDIREDLLDRMVAIMVDLSGEEEINELPELNDWFDDEKGALKGEYSTAIYLNCVQVELDNATNREAEKVAPMVLALLQHLVTK